MNADFKVPLSELLDSYATWSRSKDVHKVLDRQAFFLCGFLFQVLDGKTTVQELERLADKNRGEHKAYPHLWLLTKGICDMIQTRAEGKSEEMKLPDQQRGEA